MANKPPTTSKEKMTRKSQADERSIHRLPPDHVRTAADEGTFQRFIENLPAMFYAVEPAAPHTPIYISPTFEMFGYPLDEWMTDSDIWDRVIHPDDRESVLGNTREAMSKGESVDFEYRVVSKNGDVFWVRDRSCFIKDKDGKLLCWQGVMIDVTDRKAADEA